MHDPFYRTPHATKTLFVAQRNATKASFRCKIHPTKAVSLYIEKFGTGVLRIIEAYSDFDRKPLFDVRAESIVVTLPVASETFMSSEEKAVIAVMPRSVELSRSEIESLVGFSRDKTIRILHALLDKGVLVRRGEGRTTRYYRQ